jgi:hypothetical protein
MAVQLGADPGDTALKEVPARLKLSLAFRGRCHARLLTSLHRFTEAGALRALMQVNPLGGVARAELTVARQGCGG